MKTLLASVLLSSLANAAYASPAYIQQSPFLDAAPALTIDMVDFSSIAAQVDAVMRPLSQGNLPAATVIQTGLFNQADITQTGTDNLGLIVQRGTANSASLLQGGSRNIGFVQQVGYGNAAALTQLGSGHNAFISQQGRGNVAVVRQY